MNIKPDKWKTAVALAAGTAILILLSRIFRLGGLTAIFMKWLENAVFLCILTAAVTEPDLRVYKFAVSLAALSLLEVIGEEVYYAFAPYSWAVMPGTATIGIYVMFTAAISLLLCRESFRERRDRVRDFRLPDVLACALLLAASAAVMVKAGKSYEAYYESLFSGGAADLFSMMTSNALNWINIAYLAVRLVSKAACVWALACGVIGFKKPERNVYL